MKKGAALFWVLHLVLNALLGLLFYQWLHIPDVKLWQVGATLVSGGVLLFALLWLHGATFAFFGGEGSAWARGLRRLPLFALWAVLFAVAVSVAARWPMVWIAVAALLLPLAGFAVNGAGALASYKHWWYWVCALGLLVVGVYLPYKLVTWVPGVHGLTLQTISLVARAGIGYLLLVTAWLMLAYVSVGGRPWAAQPRTVALP